MQSCLALRFLVKRENDGARGRLMNIYFLSNIGPRLACMRTSRKTSARLKITFVDMTYPKGWTGSLLLCPLIFSWFQSTLPVFLFVMFSSFRAPCPASFRYFRKCSFSFRYHRIHSDFVPDLRDSTITGRQHFFWGVHACVLR